jgi:hypothetical protein
MGAAPSKVATTQYNSMEEQSIHNNQNRLSHTYSQSKSNEVLIQMLDAKRELDHSNQSHLMSN